MCRCTESGSVSVQKATVPLRARPSDAGPAPPGPTFLHPMLGARPTFTVSCGLAPGARPAPLPARPFGGESLAVCPCSRAGLTGKAGERPEEFPCPGERRLGERVLRAPDRFASRSAGSELPRRRAGAQVSAAHCPPAPNSARVNG